MEIASAFVTIRPQTDSFASELASGLGSVDDVEVPVTADTSDAQAAVEEVGGEEVEVGVTADTGDAQAEVDSIEGGEATVAVSTEGVEDAQAQVDSLTDSTNALGEAAQGALGGVGGLGGAAGGAAGALGSTALAGAAAGAGLMAFAQDAIDAESATQRFNLITGALADQLSTIDVGGLSGDIGELALQLGSSDEAMLNATASFVSFAQSTGASDDQIVAASDNINALALRAVALNPALGDAGAVAERMTNALARGGRATTAFGIGLTSAEINARAMADTGKQNANELTQFEKAAAGAQIAVERLGDTMGSDFQAGSENARTEWNRMTEQLGEAAESTGSVMLPAIENITGAVTELASGLANLSPKDWLSGLWDLSGGLIANGVTDLWSTISGGEEQIAGTGRVIGELPPALRDAADAGNAAADAIADLGQSVDEYLTRLFSVPDAQRELRQSFSDLATAMAEGSWDDQAVAMEDVVTNTAQLITKQQEQGASQAQLDTTIYASIATLAEMRDAGTITGAQFDTLSGQIRGVPHQAVTAVSTPGLPESQNRVVTYRGHVVSVPPDWRTNFTANTGGAISSIQALINKIDELNNTVVRSPGSGIAGQVGAITAGLGESSAPVGGGGELTRTPVAVGARSTVTVQIPLDGRVVAETVFEIDRQQSIAEGYEQ